MKLSTRFFRWHRWVGYLIALQVLAWVLGGMVFAWVPFQGWVKVEDALIKPQQDLPADWVRALAAAESLPTPLLSVGSVATASGPALKLRHAHGEHWLSAGGGELAQPDVETIGRYARSLYRGGGALAGVERLGEVPVRLLMVRELGERKDVWLARFDDGLSTRFYFDGRSGELLAGRNDAWVAYDFFWRLHVMDYTHGKDFNNLLLRASAVAATGLVLTGLVLMVLALRRAARRRARP